MLKLKYILNDLVEYAYADDPRLPRYKRFYVEYLKKKLKTKNGDYREDNHHLRIFTEGREDVAVIKTSIHELSHHVDYMQRNHTNHDSRFYAVYRKLLYAALDMEIIRKQDYFNCIKDSRDATKVTKMLEEYQPKKTGYKKGLKRVCVKRAFEIREALKQRGYTYNSYDKSWEKEIEAQRQPEEESFLISIGAEYVINNALHLTF